MQAFEKSVPGPVGLKSEVEVLCSIIERISDREMVSSNLDSVWELVNSGQNSLLSTLKYSDVAKSMVHLDGSAWSHLNFVEKPALNFEPAGSEAS